MVSASRRAKRLTLVFLALVLLLGTGLPWLPACSLDTWLMRPELIRRLIKQRQHSMRPGRNSPTRINSFRLPCHHRQPAT